MKQFDVCHSGNVVVKSYKEGIYDFKIDGVSLEEILASAMLIDVEPDSTGYKEESFNANICISFDALPSFGDACLASAAYHKTRALNAAANLAEIAQTAESALSELENMPVPEPHEVEPNV